MVNLTAEERQLLTTKRRVLLKTAWRIGNRWWSRQPDSAKWPHQCHIGCGHPVHEAVTGAIVVILEQRLFNVLGTDYLSFYQDHIIDQRLERHLGTRPNEQLWDHRDFPDTATPPEWHSGTDKGLRQQQTPYVHSTGRELTEKEWRLVEWRVNGGTVTGDLRKFANSYLHSEQLDDEPFTPSVLMGQRRGCNHCDEHHHRHHVSTGSKGEDSR